MIKIFFMKLTNNYEAGFTLIELLVSVALFSLIMASALSILAVVVKNNYKAQKVMRIRSLGDNAINMIHRVVATANAITTSSFPSSSLVFSQPGGINYDIECDEGGNILQMSKTDDTGTNVTILIQDANVDISACEFNCGDRACTFSISLSMGGDTSETFSTQTTLRNDVNFY